MVSLPEELKPAEPYIIQKVFLDQASAASKLDIEGKAEVATFIASYARLEAFLRAAGKPATMEEILTTARGVLENARTFTNDMN